MHLNSQLSKCHQPAFCPITGNKQNILPAQSSERDSLRRQSRRSIKNIKVILSSNSNTSNKESIQKQSLSTTQSPKQVMKQSQIYRYHLSRQIKPFQPNLEKEKDEECQQVQIEASGCEKQSQNFPLQTIRQYSEEGSQFNKENRNNVIEFRRPAEMDRLLKKIRIINFDVGEEKQINDLNTSTQRGVKSQIIRILKSILMKLRQNKSC